METTSPAAIPSSNGHNGIQSHARDAGTGKNPSAVRRAARILARATARQCPNCGSGNVFQSYLRQRAACPACSLRLDRGETDFFIGAYTINLIVAELLVFFGGMAVLIRTWPDVPWTGLTWGLAALMVAAPVALYPYSRQLWLACDLIFRPPTPGDFEH